MPILENYFDTQGIKENIKKLMQIKRYMISAYPHVHACNSENAHSTKRCFNKYAALLFF